MSATAFLSTEPGYLHSFLSYDRNGSAAAMPPRGSTSHGPRGRCTRACDSCKRRKEKCNGVRPCTLCTRRQKEAVCHFSDTPARLLKSGGPETMLLSENMARTTHVETTMDRILNSLENNCSTLEQTRGEEDGTAPVPKFARLLRDGQGKFMYIGDSAGLSFLQSVRRIVSTSIGSSDFTTDDLRHSILETIPSVAALQTDNCNAPSYEEAEILVDQYRIATSGLLDLFDMNDFLRRLAVWVEDSSRDADFASSIFYLVLAIGAQVSSSKGDQSFAEQYFVKGRQLAFTAFTEAPSLLTIQSYILISMYMLGACRRNGAFMNLGTALRAAYALGIHRRNTNSLFCDKERRARERIWKSLRVIDLFLSASLGRPPATSDFEHEHSDWGGAAVETHSLTPDEQISSAVITLCGIFERILTDVYKRQMTSTQVADRIASQYRVWALNLPSVLKMESVCAEPCDTKNLGDVLAASHVLGAYYWSIILLTRPFLTSEVSEYVKNKAATHNAGEMKTGNSQTSVFADACVDSALRGLEIADGIRRYHYLPKRLPFILNSVFNSALVLGAAFFADYDNLLPLNEGMDKAERFLEIFAPDDPQACRFSEVIRYLRSAVADYVNRRNQQWMEQRSKQVKQLFGQVRLSSDQTTISTTENRVSGDSFYQSRSSPTTAGGDIWESLCGDGGPSSVLDEAPTLTQQAYLSVPLLGLSL